MTRNDRRHRGRAAGGSNASSHATKPARNVIAATTASVETETGDGARVGSSTDAPVRNAATAAAMNGARRAT